MIMAFISFEARVSQTGGPRKKGVREMASQGAGPYRMLVGENDPVEAQCQQTRAESDVSKPRSDRGGL